MQEHASTRVFCPAATVAPLERFVAAASALEERPYDYELVAMNPGDRVELGRDFAVEAFATEHPVASVGYHLWRRKSSLAPEFQGLEPEELERLRAEGTKLSAVRQEIALSYCGDTGPGVFAGEPRLFRSPILVLETTYLGPGLRERGRQYGHMHLEDLVELGDRFENEALVLFHLSRRHRLSELRQELDERLPDLAERIYVVGFDDREPVAERASRR